MDFKLISLKQIQCLDFDNRCRHSCLYHSENLRSKAILFYNLIWMLIFVHFTYVRGKKNKFFFLAEDLIKLGQLFIWVSFSCSLKTLYHKNFGVGSNLQLSILFGGINLILRRLVLCYYNKIFSTVLGRSRKPIIGRKNKKKRIELIF